jgi:hypothetical protein
MMNEEVALISAPFTARKWSEAIVRSAMSTFYASVDFEMLSEALFRCMNPLPAPWSGGHCPRANHPSTFSA